MNMRGNAIFADEKIRRSTATIGMTTHVQKVRNHLLPGARQYAFRMELHPLDRELAMPQTHDDARAIRVRE